MFPAFPFLFSRLRFSNLLLPAVAVGVLLASWNEQGNRSYLPRPGYAVVPEYTITHHRLLLQGKLLRYRATTGYLTIPDRKGKAAAHIFYTAYTAESSRLHRPVTFVFNGGPGSASIWLHLGAFEPVRAVPGRKGYRVNPCSWLSFTDLVFIDPVGTGYSRPAAGVSERSFYGYHEDIQSIARFIQVYLAQDNQFESAIFLAGESYGAARAVGLTTYLKDTLGIRVNGLTLISPALNYRLLTFRKGNTFLYPHYLPAYAVTAQYHHRLASELQRLPPAKLNARVARFSQTTYRRFLYYGRKVPVLLRQRVIDSLSYFTGIRKTEFNKAGGRMSDVLFTRSLLQSKGKVVGTFDSRITGTGQTSDPSEAALRAVFPPAFRAYLRSELEYQTSLPYRAASAMTDWNYELNTSGGYFDVSAVLERLLQHNAGLKVSVACGYYDLATPVSATQYVIRHMHLSASQLQNLKIDYYLSGHMIYTSDEANTRFYYQSQAFYHNTLACNAKL